MSFATPDSSRGHRRLAFTLTELLVVMGVIGVLAALTVVSVKSISKDARLSSATNTVTAVLDNARAPALKKNRPVLVAFLPRYDGSKQRIEAVIAEWTGDSDSGMVEYPWARKIEVADRFRVVPGVPVRPLPVGVNIGGPAYAYNDGRGNDADDQWLVATDFSKGNETPGEPVGVMFTPNGSVVTNNPANDSSIYWIDRDNDQVQTLSIPVWPDPVQFYQFHEMIKPTDEVAIHLVPFLAIFDEDEVREIYTSATGGEWTSGSTRADDLSEYIREKADRIHFNRYTGVVMR